MYLTPQSEAGIRETVLWDISDGWNETQKQIIRNWVQNGMNMFGLQGFYQEVNYELNQNGIDNYDGYNTTLEGEIGLRVRPGGDNTDKFHEYIYPTSENRVYVTPASNITISLNELTFYKEKFGRGLGINEITDRESYMNPSGGTPNNKDKVITNMIVTSYTFRLGDKTQYFGYENMVDDVE